MTSPTAPVLRRPRRHRAVRLLPVLALPLVLSVAAAGCIEREGRPVNPCTNVTIADTIQVTNVDKVDLLFMVDNSNSMEQEQTSLTIEFPRMIEILTTGEFDEDPTVVGPDDFEPVTDLNVGVITSDMGTANFTVNTCLRSQFGDDGILRMQGRADLAGCMASYPSFLNFRPDEGGDAEAFAGDVACVATVGTGGCGFEQQLEAILKALSPARGTDWTRADYAPPGFFGGTFGHGDGNNLGFARADSVLAIIPVTDEEDCSALDGELFNPASATYGATDLNLRCFAHAQEALHPISRYVEGLLQLRQREDLLIYAPIVGIPVDLAPGENNFEALVGATGVRDPRMEEQIDPVTGNRLVPSCDEPGRGQAYPPIRITRVARDLQARGAGVTVQSICQDSFRPALNEIIRQIKSALGAACLPRQLNIEADGKVQCEVVAVMPTDVPCNSLAGATAREQDGVPVVEEGNRAVCVLEQLVATDRAAGAAPPAGDGWYYDSFTTEVFDNCVRAVTPQRIAFTNQPPSGAEVRLECFQSVQNTGAPGEVVIGTFCTPGSDTTCPTGVSTAGAELMCDRVTRACGVPCTTNASCNAAGLVGFVCDQRSLEEVDPDQFPGETEAHSFCVNPTC